MPEFDPTTPSVARVYDYVLGGKDNYAADRDVADRLLAIVPLIADMAVDARQWHQEREPAALSPRAGFVVAGVSRKR